MLLLNRILIKILKKNINVVLFSHFFRKIINKTLGISVGLGSYGYLNFPRGTIIGAYCSFAEGVRYLPGNHPISHFSTAAVFFNPKLGYVSKEYDIERAKLTIGNDVWIGQNVLITNKCLIIGDGAIIAAGSIVTKDVPPYTIIGGNPAKIIRMRFDENTIKALNESKWWNVDLDNLIKHINLRDKPMEFANRICNVKSNKL